MVIMGQSIMTIAKGAVRAKLARMLLNIMLFLSLSERHITQ